MTSIPSVSKGDHVAIITLPTRGTPGIALDGCPLPTAGHNVDLVVGEGVEFDDSTKTYIAAKDGRPMLKDNALCVLDVYEVEATSICPSVM